MTTAMIIGAGGSLAQAQHFRPVRRREHPPLDGNFFTCTAQLAEADDEVSRVIRSLKREIQRTAMFIDPWTEPCPPMEQYFADVYYEVASGTDAAFPLFTKLLRLYVVMLGKTTNWLVDRSQRGVLGWLIRKEMESLNGDKLTIITFNQDLVLENVIEGLPNRFGLFGLRELYSHVDLNPAIAPPGVPTFSLGVDSNEGAPLPVSLLKLHGSLNWGTKSTNREPTKGTLFPRQTNRSVHVVNSRRVINDIMLKTHAPKGRKRWFLWPLVVPPIYDKQRITATSLFEDLWNRARRAVETARKLVLVGYSMPDADILARQMIRRAFDGNDALECVECVNPDSDMAPKLRRALGADVVRLYASLESYLKYD